MAIDQQIAAGIQPTTPAHSLLQSVGGIMQLRGQMGDAALQQAQLKEVEQRQQVEKLKLDQANRDLADDNILKALAPEDYSKVYKGDFAGLQGKVQNKTIQALTTFVNQTHEKLATLDEKTLKNQAEALTQLKDTAINLGAPMADGKDADPATINSRYQSAKDGLAPLLKLAGITTPLPATISTPDELRDIQARLHGAEAAANSALSRKEATAKTEKAVTDAAIAGKVNTGTNDKGVSEEKRLDLEGKDLDRQLTAKYRDAELKQAAEKIGIERQRLFQDKEETTLTPEALSKMAEMFATTGTMPTLGQGKNAAQMRSKIINEAAKAYPSVQFATNQAAFQANKTSLSSLQKQFDAVNAFEETAGKNLDTFLKQADKVIDLGSPWINKPLRAVNAGLLGSTDQAAFNAARQTAVTEIGKVLSSASGNGVLSDSAREEVQHLIGPDATLKQIVAAAKILKQDMGNRKDSYKDQIHAINERITGKKEDAPANVEVISPEGVHGTIPADKLDAAIKRGFKKAN